MDVCINRTPVFGCSVYIELILFLNEDKNHSVAYPVVQLICLRLRFKSLIRLVHNSLSAIEFTSQWIDPSWGSVNFKYGWLKLKKNKIK